MNAAATYRKTQSQTANREQLMQLLFERALRDVRAGIAALHGGKRADALHLLTHASDIVLELRGSLDAAKAPELVANLKELYGFCAARLTQAAVKGDVKLAQEAERAFAPIADAFCQAVAQVQRG